MKTVLIIEDEKPIRVTLAEALKDSGEFKMVVVAKDGVEALQMVSNQKFDLICTDVQMPRMSGLDCIKHIKNQEKTKKEIVPTKFLIFSGNLQAASVKEAIGLGVKDILAKPCSPKEVVEKVLSMIN